MRKPSVQAVLIALIAVACGGPEIVARRVEPGGPALFPGVVDVDGDAGAGLSMTSDADGNPQIAYLAFEEEAGGEETPAADPFAPTLPAVKLAFLADEIWNRVAVAEEANVTAGDQTAVAVDTEGVHHVVWTEEGELRYSSDAEGEFSKPEPIPSSGAEGPSIAVGEGGVKVAFYEIGTGPEGPGALIRVATAPGKGGWSVETAAEAGAPSLPATGIGMTGRETLVAYGSEGQTLVARSTGGRWTSETVDPDGGEGVTMALDAEGVPHLAYFTEGGEVRHAHPAGESWEISDIADAGGLPDAGSAAIAVDPAGIHTIAWQTSDATIEFSTNEEGDFSDAEEVPSSESGTEPGVAAAEGQAMIAWYDTEGTEVQFALRSEDEPLLAVPSPSALPGGGGAPAAECQPQGPGVAIEAPPGAVTEGFTTDCLAVPVGEPYTIDFNNQDPGQPHNVNVYTDDSATESLLMPPLEGQIIGPDSITYEGDPIDEEGEYFFQCDFHAATMTGTFVVAQA
jgi:plastocyanin